MEQYRDDARMAVMGALKIVDAALMRSEGKDRAELDEVIAELGTKRLTRSQLRTFFHAFYCRESWEQITELLNAVRPKPMDVESVKKSARESLKRLRDIALTFGPLQEWLKRYRSQSGQ